MKKIIIALALLPFCITVIAQQVQMVSQFGQQNILINPAAAGANGHTTIGANFRKMWGDFPGAPQTTIIYGDGYLAKSNLGIGGSIYNDVTGPSKRNGFTGSVAYHIPLSAKTKLSFGMEARVLNFRYDQAKLSQFLVNDPILGQKNNSTLFDAGFGFMVKNDKYTLGFSAQQLLQSKTNFLNSSTTTTDGKLYRHYYFMGSVNIFDDGNTVITPNFLIKYLPNAPVEVDAGARLEHNKLFWWGVNTRLRQNFSLFAGVHAKNNLSVGYAFDVYKTPLSLFDNGGNAHEIMIQYKFKKK
jgi:type IX secretion system PorP/SprF family membrane protein